MDVLLLNAPTGFPRMAKGTAIPLGLAYLAGYLRNRGVNVFAIDLDIEEWSEDKLKSLIEREPPILIGISCTSHTRFNAFKLANKFKSDFLGIHLTIGGHHVSSASFDTLNNVNIDSVIRGEGEITLFELFSKLRQNQNLSSVLGLSYRKDDVIVDNPPRELISDLDSLPYPARDLFSAEKYNLIFPPVLKTRPKKVEYLITSRGCPFACRFCSTSITWGREVRYRSPKSVVDEIQYVIENRKCDGLYIYDDHFILDTRRVLEICDEMQRKGIKIPFTCYSRIDAVTPEKIKRLSRVGLKFISFGIESGSSKVLDYYNKKITIKQIIKAVKICQQFGVIAKGTFIVGAPVETIKDFKDTCRLINKLRDIQPEFIASVSTKGLFIYPGTQVYEDALKEGVLPQDFSWSDENPKVFRYLNVPMFITPQVNNLLKVAPMIYKYYGIIYLVLHPKALFKILIRKFNKLYKSIFHPKELFKILTKKFNKLYKG